MLVDDEEEEVNFTCLTFYFHNFASKATINFQNEQNNENKQKQNQETFLTALCT